MNLSDRRLGKAVRLIRLAATAAGATEVSELDAFLAVSTRKTMGKRGDSPLKKGSMYIKGLNVNANFRNSLQNGCWVLASS